MILRSLQSFARAGALALDALANGRDLRTVASLRGAGIFKLPILFGDLRPGMAPTILDVGAARGEAGQWALNVFPNATLHSFEPIASEFAALKAASTISERWHVYNLAIADAVGTRDMIVCDRIKQASSFFAPAQASIRGWPEQDFSARHVERVTVTTLEEFAKRHNIGKVDILKLDVQGAERDVLRGAGAFLDDVRYIITEVAFQPMYEGGCLFADIVDELRARGRHLRAFANEFRDSEGRLVQADALFG
jgi:FkbM family methyltransferase